MYVLDLLSSFPELHTGKCIQVAQGADECDVLHLLYCLHICRNLIDMDIFSKSDPSKF